MVIRGPTASGYRKTGRAQAQGAGEERCKNTKIVTTVSSEVR